MESNVNFKYYAFISYSHEDEEYAKRIQKKLTEYKLPSVIRKANPLLPDNVRPIFRDATNLTTGMLQGTLHSELEHSKFLIVLCSPNSAKPNDENKHWVNNEVQHFIDIGRAEFIIPVIVGGEPHASNSEEECFCPALLSLPGGDELLGIDIRKNLKKKITFGKSIKRKLGIPDEDDLEEKAIVHIVAKMLGLTIDDLWDWNKKAQKRKAYTRLFTAAACFVVMLSAGLTIYFKKFHVYHEYFVDYVERAVQKKNGTDIEFTGLGKLLEEELKGREKYYRFDYIDGKLKRIIPVNSVKNSKELLSEFEYNGSTGLLQARILKNANNTIIVRNVYEQQGAVIDFKSATGSPTSFNVDLSWLEAVNAEGGNANIKSKKFERNEAGYVVRELFFGSHGAEHPAKDKDGTAGVEFVLDELGRPVQTWYLGYRNDSSITNNEVLFYRQPLKDGMAGYFYEYDDNFNICKLMYVNSDGKPIRDWNGAIVTVYEYQNGNLIRETFCDDSGAIYPNYEGIAYIEYEYDDLGRHISTSFHDKNGGYICNSDKYAIEKVSYDKNENVNIITRYYYDENNVLCLNEDGFAISKRLFDLYGNCIESSCYDSDEKPVDYGDSGWHKATISYNDKGFIEFECFFDQNGLPVLGSGEFAKAEFLYNDENEVKEVRYFDTDFKTLKESWENIAITTYEYDKLGNIVEEKNFDRNRKPALTKFGHFSKKIDFDAYGNKIGVSYFDIDNKPVIIWYGFAVSEHKYDKFGNCISSAYYSDSEKQKLCDTSYGYAYIEYEYDDKGNEIYQKRYNSKKEPLEPFCIIKKEYDDNNNVTKISYFDKNNKLAKCGDNYAQVRYEYNEYGQVIKEEFFDETLQHALLHETIELADIWEFFYYAIVYYEYDTHKNLIKKTFYDNNAVLGIQLEWKFGSKKDTYVFHLLLQDGQERDIFYENGNIVHTKSCFADGYTNERFYDDGKLIHTISNFSDGDKLEEFYENGERVREIWIKNDGYKSETFYEDGGRVREIWNHNDGTKTEEFYENGERVKRNEFYDGYSIEELYENGQRTREIIRYDTGNKYELLYEDGNWNPVHNELYTDVEGKTDILDHCYVSLKLGMINGLNSTTKNDFIKMRMPFFTGETPFDTMNYGGGVFYGTLDIYFYTYLQLINIRKYYKGKIDIPIFEMTFDEIKGHFGDNYKIVETKNFHTLYEYQQPYGFLYLRIEDDRCYELYFSKERIDYIDSKYEKLLNQPIIVQLKNLDLNNAYFVNFWK